MKAVWEWIKKYWQLLVTGLLVFIGFAFGVTIAKRRTAPVAPLNPEKEKAEKEAASAIRKAEQKAADQKAEVVKEHEADTIKIVEDAEKKTEEARHDTDKTNDYLKSVGKVVRGDE